MATGRSVFPKIIIKAQLPELPIKEMVKVYRDVERTIRGLRNGNSVSPCINVRKLIDDLSRSKRDFGRRIEDRLKAKGIRGVLKGVNRLSIL